MASKRRQRTRPPARPARKVIAPGALLIYALASLLVIAAAWAYAPGFAGVFVLDDVRAIEWNPSIRTLWPLSTPLAPPSQATVAGRPIANLSFAVNYALAPAADREVFSAAGPGGGEARTEAFLRNAWGYHLGNLLIHIGAILALFGVVRRTLLTDALGSRFESTAPWIAWTIALLWALHPLLTGAVTYIVQRVESLMGLFYLLTMYCAVRASTGPHARAFAAAAVASCACGMGTKEVMVAAPLMVAAWDHFFGRDRWSRPRVVLLAGLAATWFVLAALVYHERRAPSISLAGDMVWRYLLTQAEVVVHYLRLAFFPSPLAFLYDWPLASSILAVAPQLALLAALLAVTVYAFARRHPAGFLGAWFFLILAPSSSVLPIVTETAAEHRMYLPLAAVVAAVVFGAYAAGRRLLPAGRTATAAALFAVVLVAGTLGVLTRDRNAVYASEVALWQDTVAARPNDPRPRTAYGSALASAGRMGDAEVQLLKGVELAPGDPIAHVRLGAVLAQQNKLDAAATQFEMALALRPDDVDAHRFLGEICAIRRQDQQAVEHYEQALIDLPDDVDLTARLAAILADSRDAAVRNPTRALELAERAARLTSRGDARILEILAVAQAAVGRFLDAAATAREAAAIARARGDRQQVATLEYRASAYEVAARQGFSPRR